MPSRSFESGARRRDDGMREIEPHVRRAKIDHVVIRTSRRQLVGTSPSAARDGLLGARS